MCSPWRCPYTCNLLLSANGRERGGEGEGEREKRGPVLVTAEKRKTNATREPCARPSMKVKSCFGIRGSSCIHPSHLQAGQSHDGEIRWDLPLNNVNRQRYLAGTQWVYSCFSMLLGYRGSENQWGGVWGGGQKATPRATGAGRRRGRRHNNRTWLDVFRGKGLLSLR